MKPRILYVDDEKENLTSFKFLFKKEFDIELSDSPQTALSILENEQFHIIVSDQRMPNMSGSEFLAKVYDKYPETIRILLTGYSDIDSIVYAINESQIFRYILKPFEFEEIKITFNKAFQMYQERTGYKRVNKDLNNKIDIIGKIFKRIENNKKEWELFFNKISIFILKTDENLNISEVNNYLLEFTGYKKESLIGKNIQTFIKAIENKILSKQEIVDNSYDTNFKLILNSGKEVDAVFSFIESSNKIKENLSYYCMGFEKVN